jgi:hypothetical protein
LDQKTNQWGFFVEDSPMDSKQSREFIVESIETAIRDNNGTFPAAGHTLIEKLVERK